jgi:chemotaxis protein CheD
MTVGGLQRVNIVQGEYYVSDDPNLTITTLLGSCIATCMFDPLARVGGMNHFLLPGEVNASHSQEGGRYGVHLMELLINGLLKLGASRDRLESKIFGGANTVKGLGTIGSNNAKFAKEFLAMEGIACVGGSVGGDQGRRIQFLPTIGKARQMLVTSEVAIQPIAKLKPAHEQAGELELF